MQRIVSYIPLLLALVFVLPAPAKGAEPKYPTRLQIPLEGTVYVPLANGATDTVILSGDLNLLIEPPEKIPPCPPMIPPQLCGWWRIIYWLNHLRGIGDVTGKRYIAIGADQVNFPSFPTDSIILRFSLIPLTPPKPLTPPDPVLPLDVEVFFTSNENGQLEVTIGELSVPSLD
jgi:hypothetical protein